MTADPLAEFLWESWEGSGEVGKVTAEDLRAALADDSLPLSAVDPEAAAVVDAAMAWRVSPDLDRLDALADAVEAYNARFRRRP